MPLKTSELRAPMFKISVGLDDKKFIGKKPERTFVELPPQLLKQISKVELTEILDSTGNSSSRIELFIVEPSAKSSVRHTVVECVGLEYEFIAALTLDELPLCTLTNTGRCTVPP